MESKSEEAIPGKAEAQMTAKRGDSEIVSEKGTSLTGCSVGLLKIIWVSKGDVKEIGGKSNFICPVSVSKRADSVIRAFSLASNSLTLRLSLQSRRLKTDRAGRNIPPKILPANVQATGGRKELFEAPLRRVCRPAGERSLYRAGAASRPVSGVPSPTSHREDISNKHPMPKSPAGAGAHPGTRTVKYLSDPNSGGLFDRKSGIEFPDPAPPGRLAGSQPRQRKPELKCL